MNRPDEQHSAQGAARSQDHAAASTQSDAKDAAEAAKTGNETVSMGSPAFGLGGRPVPKDAIHSNT